MSFQDPAIIRTVTDQTASRAIDGTVYTNTTGNTLFITVTVLCASGSTGASGATAYGFVGAAVTGKSGIAITNAVASLVIYTQLSWQVPPGITYKVTSQTTGTGTLSLSSWIESY